jgi:hypothetical protein
VETNARGFLGYGRHGRAREAGGPPARRWARGPDLQPERGRRQGPRRPGDRGGAGGGRAGRRDDRALRLEPPKGAPGGRGGDGAPAPGETERIVKRSPVPWTILRATQFHGLVLGLIQALDRLPIVPLPRGILLQPVDVGEVAGRMVELAPPAGRVPNAGGPEVRTFADLARSYFEAAGRRKRSVEVPVAGKIARALREGAQTAPNHRYGEIRWEEFLDRALHREGDYEGRSFRR